MKENSTNKGVFIRLLAVTLIICILGIPACTTVNEQTNTETAAEMTETEIAETTEAETEPEAPAMKGKVKIKPTGDVVYPYLDNVKAYLEAGEGADVSKYLNGSNDQHEDIIIEWEYDGDDEVSSYLFECSVNEDFSDAITAKMSSVTLKRRLTNLHKGQTYYVRVTAVGNEASVSDTLSFQTTTLGPRILNVGGYYNNVRDMGGYVTEDGHVVLQDKIIRGSALDNCVDIKSSTLNSIGRRFLNDELCIKTELDLRTSGENCGRTTSVLTSAENYYLIQAGSYSAAFNKDHLSVYRDVFRVFADENNYPIYFHCAGGADRTGTVAAILEALLGVSRKEIIQDFELTSFSRVGERPAARIEPVLNQLELYNGETLSEKAESYLLTTGLTQKEIYNIKAIMLGLDRDGFIERTVHELQKRDLSYSTEKGGDMKLTLYDEAAVKAVTVNGVDVPFTQNGKNVVLSESGLKEAGKGSVKGVMTFEDGISIKFNVIIDELDITQDFKAAYVSEGPDSTYYTYVFLTYPYAIFDGVEYHFYSRPQEFPDVAENILLNGVSVKELNQQSLKGYTFAEFPGSSMEKYQIPVNILCSGANLTLLIHTGWYRQFAGDKGLDIKIKQYFEFTNKGVRYYITRDKEYSTKTSGFREVK